jgi:uncharacterized protein (TIGR03067 family)
MKQAHIVWIATLGLAVAGCNRPGSSANDLQTLQGTWTMVETTWDGQPQPGEMQWVVEGNQYRIRVDQRLNPDPYQFTLDTEHRRIDVFHHDTPPGTFGGKLKGIYKLSGDSLTVCYDLTATRYPDSYKAPVGSRRVVYQFRRQ